MLQDLAQKNQIKRLTLKIKVLEVSRNRTETVHLFKNLVFPFTRVDSFDFKTGPECGAAEKPKTRTDIYCILLIIPPPI